MNKLTFTLAILLFALMAVGQETFPVNGVANKNHNSYAFINAQIHVDYQTVIDKGTLLIKEGRVVAAATTVNIPKGTVVYDLKGKHIYPGLIDMYTSYGLPEIKKNTVPGSRQGPQLESNTKGAYAWNQAIKPETNAAKTFTVDVKAAEEMIKLGFSTVLTFQRDGIARGTGALVNLGSGKENDEILSEQAAAFYSFDKGSSTQDYPNSLMGAIALLRQSYLDAQWYQESKGNKGLNLSLEAWNQTQKLPQVFEVNNKLSALRAIKLAEEFKKQYIIKGSGEEYQRISDMKNTRAPFIIPLNFPVAFDLEDPYEALQVSLKDLKHWEMAALNPYALESNGIAFALTTADLKDKKDFWKNLRKAIAYGLSEKQALKSLTATPADLLGMSQQIGALKPGMIANFLVTSTNLFDEKNVVFENWIDGKPYLVSETAVSDIRGTFALKIGNDASYTLKINGEIDKPKGTLTVAGDSTKIPVNLSAVRQLITLTFTQKTSKKSIRLSGSIGLSPLLFNGRGQLENGEWVDWSATWTAAAEEKKDSLNKKEIPLLSDVTYPFLAYGQRSADRISTPVVLIKNATVWTNEKEGILKAYDVLISNGKISQIAEEIDASKIANVKVIDGTGKHLTPGIIDEHSHIAISNGVNEGTQASSAEVRVGDVVNSEDINIYRQLAGGVTTSQLLHGSANPIGGQSALVKLRWGTSPEEMKISGADGFIKFALGENVKQSNWGDNNVIRFPQTRMGVEQVYVDYFTRAKEYEARWKAYGTSTDKNKVAPRKDLELEAIVEILNKKRFITCHSYVQSEINMLMHLADSMGFKVNTFTHILEGYKVADKMKAHGVGGSTFSDWWSYKMEVKEAIPYNAAILAKMGIVTAINSDDAEMGRRLNQEAAKSVKYGNLSEEEALKLVTLNPAQLLHLDQRMGSVKPGKDADLVLWSGHPLSIYSRAEKTMVDGVIYFDIEKDLLLREEIKKEKARLIQKMIAEKNSGEKTQKAIPGKEPKLYECEDLEEDYMTE